MWPFNKPSSPEPVTVGGLTASFSRQVEQWELTVDGIDFTYGPRDLDLAIFEWARTLAPMVQQLKEPILAAARNSVSDWDKLRTESAEILSVDLSEYPSMGLASVDVTGDDSWGDLGVTVVLKNGQIIAVDSGD
ncbi:MAG: hypothetical protein MUF31_02025 [Akkermansiaceae bacterium]|jgi:hypothetical protein|nr:hypothetical protein [Akkermansiaceae bacterium]